MVTSIVAIVLVLSKGGMFVEDHVTTTAVVLTHPVLSGLDA